MQFLKSWRPINEYAAMKRIGIEHPSVYKRGGVTILDNKFYSNLISSAHFDCSNV